MEVVQETSGLDLEMEATQSEGDQRMKQIKNRVHVCGWCITGDHYMCKSEIEFNESVWVCKCDHVAGGEAA